MKQILDDFNENIENKKIIEVNKRDKYIYYRCIKMSSDTFLRNHELIKRDSFFKETEKCIQYVFHNIRLK